MPGQARNQHRITVEGEFGTLRIEVENVPSENPRTGRLSYLSAIAMLRELGCSRPRRELSLNEEEASAC